MIAFLTKCISKSLANMPQKFILITDSFLQFDKSWIYEIDFTEVRPVDFE